MKSLPSDRSDCSDGLLVFMQLIPPPHPTILLLLQVSFCPFACKQCQVKAHVLLVDQTAAAAAYKACLQRSHSLACCQEVTLTCNIVLSVLSATLGA